MIGKELIKRDSDLEPILSWAKTNIAEAEQLALDATRLLSCTTERHEEYENKGFFKRLWSRFTGEHGKIIRSNQFDLTKIQSICVRYIELLNKRDILFTNSLITIKNNLLALAVPARETNIEIKRLAEKMNERITDIERRVEDIEATQGIHSWLLTIDTYKYNELPQNIRLLTVARDFFNLKPDNWNIQEIKYLQQAIKTVGLNWEENIKLSNFIDGILDEIDMVSISKYKNILYLEDLYDTEIVIPESQIISSKINIVSHIEEFVSDNISVPTYTMLYKIAKIYENEIIKMLPHETDKKEFIKSMVRTYIKKEAIDLGASIPIKDIAVELANCMRLTKIFYEDSYVRKLAKDANEKILKEREKILYDTYIEINGKLLTGTVSQKRGNNFHVSLGAAEAILPSSEFLPKDIREGTVISGYLSVKKSSKGVNMELSRPNNKEFVSDLFKSYVPEIRNETVVIKKIARIDGHKTMIAVYSNDPNVDPIRACLGFNNSILDNIKNQLGDEQIRILKWSDNFEIFIGESLLGKAYNDYSDKIQIKKRGSKMMITVPDDILGLAFGKNRQNLKLVEELTGYKIELLKAGDLHKV